MLSTYGLIPILDLFLLATKGGIKDLSKVFSFQNNKSHVTCKDLTDFCRLRMKALIQISVSTSSHTVKGFVCTITQGGGSGKSEYLHSCYFSVKRQLHDLKYKNISSNSLDNMIMYTSTTTKS